MEVTRRLTVGCEFVHQSEIDIPAVFQVEPLSDQKVDVIDERWSLEPDGPTHAYTDLYGNPCRRLMMPAGRSVISYQATVIARMQLKMSMRSPELTPDQLPDEVLIYILPSRFCLPDVLGAEAWSRFGSTPPGYRRVQAICDYVHGHLRFEYGASNPMTTAADAHTTATGSAGTSPPRGLVLPRAQHSCSLRLRLLARDRHPTPRSADGFRGLDGGLSG